MTIKKGVNAGQVSEHGRILKNKVQVQEVTIY